MLNIIIVEDHIALREELVDFLERPDWIVKGVGSGMELNQELNQKIADIVILDLQLPDEDGIQIATRIRSVFPCIGIIMLTARNSACDRALGYGMGADVYLTKPAHVGELESVIHNLGKRLNISKKIEDNKQEHILLNTKYQTIQNRIHPPLNLNSMETNFLYRMAMRHCNDISYDELDKNRKTIVVTVSRLRQKLSTIGEENLIRTVHGFGYKLSKPILVME